MAAPMPKSVLPCRDKISTALRVNVLCTFHRWGVLVFIAYVFPNLMVVRIFFPFDEVFSAFIAIGLIRDNEGALIENYPSSLICEIRFDLQDKLLLGIILLPLLVRFSLIYRT